MKKSIEDQFFLRTFASWTESEGLAATNSVREQMLACLATVALQGISISAHVP